MRGEGRVGRAVARLAERVREEAPGLRVNVSEGRVTVSGRGVREALGWIGGLLR